MFADDYAQALSSAKVGLGLLTRRFPELHTTRTFEIPACGTVLATPENSETRQFFSDEEALFFKDYSQLAQQLRTLLANADKLQAIAQAGRQRVVRSGFSNRRVLAEILQRVGLEVEV